MISLLLPYPVSANRYWRSYTSSKWKRPVVVRSTEAASYRSEVAWIAKAQGCRVTRKPIELRVVLVPRNGTVMDLSNCIKVAEDALQGVAYVNDKQVKRITLEYGEPDGKGALLVEISEFEAAAAPLFASAA